MNYWRKGQNVNFTMWKDRNQVEVLLPLTHMELYRFTLKSRATNELMGQFDGIR